MRQELIDYERVKEAIVYISDHCDEQPELNDVAAHLGLSPFHFQRMFRRWAGVSPKKFLQYITLQRSKARLLSREKLEVVADEAGLSGTGRLHDLFVSIEGMTPHQYRLAGMGKTIHYGIIYSPFGRCLLAVTEDDRICSLFFVDDELTAIENLKQNWGNASLVRDDIKISSVGEKLFDPLAGKPVNLLLKGTTFQLKVWEALLKIPFGEVVSYRVVAEFINRPKAFRAVAGAIARNPVSFLIPCHRVLRQTGKISQYRWGKERKRALIAWEAARVEQLHLS